MLAEIARHKSGDFVRVAERLSRPIASALNSVSVAGDLAEEAEAIRHAHDKGALLRELAVTLSFAVSSYRTAREAHVALTL